MKRKKILTMLLLAVLAFGMTACGSADQDSAKAERTTEKAKDEKTEEEKTEEEKKEEEDKKEEKEEKAKKAAEKKAAEEKKSSSPRIVATSPATCDIMDRLGIDLVGVPSSGAPSRYSKVTKVGTPMSPDMEVIKSLHPTDVIGPDGLKGDLKGQYDKIGVNATFLNLRSVKGLYDSVQQVGDKYGKSEEAKAIVQEYKDFMASYSAKHGGKSPKVLVLMGLPGSYLVATNNSYAGSLVELAGGTNVFHDSKDFLTISPEEMLARDPDVIIRTAHGAPKEAQAMFAKEFSTNDIWKHFRAVENGKVYDVDYTIFGMSATFDYPQALADLEPMLYGN